MGVASMIAGFGGLQDDASQWATWLDPLDISFVVSVLVIALSLAVILGPPLISGWRSRALRFEVSNGGDFDATGYDVDYDWSDIWMQMQRQDVKGYEGPPPVGAIHQLKLGRVKNHTKWTIHDCHVQMIAAHPRIGLTPLPIDFEWIGESPSFVPSPGNTRRSLAPSEEAWVVLDYTTFNIASSGTDAAKMGTGRTLGHEQVALSIRVMGEDTPPSRTYGYFVEPPNDGLRGYARFERSTLKVRTRRRLSRLWKAIRQSTPDMSADQP